MILTDDRTGVHRIGIGFAVALGLTAACDRPFTPSQIPGHGSPALNVPYPIAEAERIEGAGRHFLQRAQFVFVSLGAVPDDRDYALPERLPSEGPMLVSHHIEPRGSDTARWQRLRRLAFGRVSPAVDRPAEVPSAQLEALGFVAPAPFVWLVGPHGACRATVGQPVIGVYEGEHPTISVNYRLEGCQGRHWAQVGIVATAIPVDFRWIPAQSTTEVHHSHGQPWSDPLAAIIEPPSWPYPEDPTTDRVDLREIPGADPRVLQLHYAQVRSPAESSEDSWCTSDVAWTRVDGWYNDRWLDPIPWSREATAPFMLGAFVHGSQVDAVLYDDRFDALVVIPPEPQNDMNDSHAWRQAFVPTGYYDPSILARWGVQPARGPYPVGHECWVTAD